MSGEALNGELIGDPNAKSDIPAEVTQTALAELDGTGWHRIDSENTVKPTSITVDLTTNNDVDVEALPDELVDGDTLDLDGLDNNEYATSHHHRFSGVSELRTTAAKYNTTIRLRIARMTPNYTCLFTFGDDELPFDGDTKMWVERNYLTRYDEVIDRDEEIGICLVKHSDSVSYGFQQTDDFAARVHLLGPFPYMKLFADYDDARAFYGLLKELGEVPFDWGQYYSCRHLIDTGLDSDIPVEVVKLGRPALATYCKTATTMTGGVSNSKVAEMIGVGSTQTVRNYLSEIRYTPETS